MNSPYVAITSYDMRSYVDIPSRPYPRKVSQKERRRKARRLRSNGIRVRKGAR